MKLSIIVPSLNGDVPESLGRLVGRSDLEGRSTGREDVEVVVVKGVAPVGKARNEGLRRVRGEYVAWVDADDEVCEEWLGEILSRVEREDRVDVVVLDYTRIGWGRETPRVWDESGRGILADMIAGRLSPEVWRFVTKRSLWEGLKFDEENEVAEDYRIMPEVVARAKTYARVGNVYRYIVNENSLIHKFSKERTIQCITAAEARLERWRGTEYEEDALAEVMKMIGWMYERGEAKDETMKMMRAQWHRAMKCRKLNLWWKFKLTMLVLGLGRILKPLYRLGG